MGDHPETHSSQQLRRLRLGDVKASGGSVLLVPMITSVYRRFGKACEGGRRNRRAPDELGSYALRQRDLELYVINTAPWLIRSNGNGYGRVEPTSDSTSSRCDGVNGQQSLQCSNHRYYG